MTEKNELPNLSLEDLLAKQKALSVVQKLFIVVQVLLVASTLSAIYLKNKDMHPFLILIFLLLIFNNGNKLKKIKTEIEKRKT